MRGTGLLCGASKGKAETYRCKLGGCRLEQRGRCFGRSAMVSCARGCHMATERPVIGAGCTLVRKIVPRENHLRNRYN